MLWDVRNRREESVLPPYKLHAAHFHTMLLFWKTLVPFKPHMPTCGEGLGEVGRERGVHEHQAVQLAHVGRDRQRRNRVEHAQRVALVQQLLRQAIFKYVRSSCAEERGARGGGTPATSLGLDHLMVGGKGAPML